MAGVIILVAVALILLSGSVPNNSVENHPKQFSTEIGKPNLDIIYDGNSPIPVLDGSLYGYYSPTKSEFIINPQFKEADRFYGDYAKVEQTSGGYSIINRSGKTILNTDSTEQIYYDVDENYWAVNGSIYNSDMEKINPDNTFAKYLGYGYMQVMTEEFPGTTYLADIPGNIVYECQANCGIILTKNINDGSDIYAAIRTEGVGVKIINLTNGQELYSSAEDVYLSKESVGVLSEFRIQDNEFVQYLILESDIVLPTQEYETDNYTTLADGKYRIADCGNDTYRLVLKTNNENVSNCEYINITAVPEYIYEKFKLEGQELAIVATGNSDDYNTTILDIANNKNLDRYNGKFLNFIDESPFILIDSDGKFRVCNILAIQAECIALDNFTDLEAYDNYLIMNGKMYNFWLKEITL